jgi:hypothetical protein
MSPDQHLILMRQWAIGLCLVVFLAAVYFFTYNGAATSTDEWFLMDATESMARRQDLQINLSFDTRPPFSIKQAQPPPADTEPLQPILASPLFLIAQALPQIGLAHTTWLFNILITALTAGVLYAYGLGLGYRTRTASVVALSFGLGTIAWPYSRTYFREPLFTLLALLSAYLMMRLRKRLSQGKRPLVLALACGLAFGGALLSKEAALLLLPVIVVEAFPSRLARVAFNQRTLWTWLMLGLVVIALTVTVVNFENWLGVDINRYDPTHRLAQVRKNLSEMTEGLNGYMFSPARSLWFFSPILLLGFAGWPGHFRHRRWRQWITPLVALCAFVGGYAAVRGPQWYGGLGWGPRYLVPVTPFVALWLFPVAESLLVPGTARWKQVGSGILWLASVSVQIVGVVVPVNLYTNVLNGQEPPVIPWKTGAWSLRWSPLRVNLDLLGDQQLDFAWRYAEGSTWLLPVGATALALLALAWGLWWLRRSRATFLHLAMTAVSLVAVAGLVMVSGLWAIRKDPRYSGTFQPMRDLLAQLEPALSESDVIVLNDNTYARFFMNYYKPAQVPVYTLPPSPGERPSPEQAPILVSNNPDELIHPSNPLIFADLSARHDRLWLIINSSRFVTWAVRPVEQYLARHYFPVREIQITDTARAILFDLTYAPPNTAPIWPQHRMDARFGDREAIGLVGFDMPGESAYGTGDILPLSLVWEARAPIDRDYTVALFLMQDDHLIAQRDAMPSNFFDPTQAWRPDSFHRDNHGLELPGDLLPGSYELWIALYWWENPSDRLPAHDADGQIMGDHVVLTTITVE